MTIEQAVNEILPFTRAYQLQELLPLKTGHNTLGSTICDTTWDALLDMLCSSGRSTLWEYIDMYAGDLYVARITMDTENVYVTIAEES